MMGLMLILVSSSLSAQSYQHFNFTKADGLPSDYVYGVIQDEKGYIYAYTENGIARFDGYEWYQFNAKDGLPGIDVHTMMKDKHGVLHGMCYNGKSFRIIGDSISSNSFDCISIVSYHGEALYRLSTNKSYQVSKSGVVNDIDISSKYHSGQELFASNNQLGFGSYFYLIEKGITGYYKKNKIYLHHHDSDNDKVILTSNRDHFKGHLINRFYKDQYVISDESGAIFLDTTLNILDTITYANQQFYQDYIILTTFKDRDDNLWVGTKNKGLLYIPASYRMISTLGDTEEDYIQLILKIGNDGILFNTDKGKLLYHQDNQTQLLKDYGTKLHQISKFHDDKVLVTNSNFHDLWSFNDYPTIEDRFNLSIVSTSDYKQQDTVIYRVSKELDYDKDKNIYFANNKFSLSKSNGGFKDGFDEIDSLNTYKFQAKTLLGEVYWRYDNGLLFYDLDMGIIQYPLKLKGISDAFSADNNNYLISTNHDGLYTWSRSNQDLRKISDLDGIRKIIPSNGLVYICTQDEVYQYSENERLKPIITIEDGLPISKINDLVNSNGSYYIGTDAGLVKLDSVDLNQMKLVSPPITNFSFRVNSTLHPGQDEVFEYSQNDVLFEYALTHYPSQDNIKYRYRLHPIERKWKATTATELNYVNLQPGSYQFEIYGQNSYGQENLIGSQSFTIKNAWYKTWWFRLLVLLILGYLFYYFMHSRQKINEEKLRKELEVKQQMASLKLSALKSQMNPHFIFNALGSIQYYIQKNEQDLADEYLGQFATLMRMYLDASKEDTISLSNEIELLQHYMELEQMRFEGLFTYDFDIQLDMNLNKQIPTMLLQPIIENAINHGLRRRDDGQGQLTIAISQSHNVIHAVITDNGIGMEAAKLNRTQKHKSHSSDILNEKISTLKEQGLFDISISYKNAHNVNKDFPGTQVTLTIEAMEQD